MKQPMMLVAACGLTLLAAAAPARAQLSGSHLIGDFGVQAGTQPQPGFYAAIFYVRYSTDVIKDASGNTVRPFPDSPGSVQIVALAPLLWHVSKVKVFGANYGAFVAPPWANGSLEAPALLLTESTGTRFSDMLVRPLDLGWHAKWADVSAGFQFYAPTGRYTRGGSDNVGKGMWTYEPFAGMTLYLDQGRSVSLATTAYWEFHSDKKDTNTRVGQILTLEGGAGKSFLGGGLIIGAAYYAQWKMTKDQLAEFVLPGGHEFNVDLPNKHRVFALGPDVTVPLASKTKLFALINVRYFWEAGSRVKTEGQNLLVTANFPIPSVTLK